MGSRVVIDQQALATGCVHWKRTVPYSNVVKRIAQTICTWYKENIVVLESRYFLDYLCHWNWFLLFLLMFNLVQYTFLIHGEGVTGREQPQGRKGRLAGPKSDIGRAEKSHKGQNVTLECYDVSPKHVPNTNCKYITLISVYIKSSPNRTYNVIFPSRNTLDELPLLSIVHWQVEWRVPFITANFIGNTQYKSCRHITRLRVPDTSLQNVRKLYTQHPLFCGFCCCYYVLTKCTNIF